MSRAQHILAVIVGLITGVLLMESYGAMVTAARAGGRAIPELWPLGTDALALAMEVSVLEAKRLLAHTDLPIGRVGAAIGFPDAANFSKFFHLHTGQTPVAFRAELR